MQLIDVVFRNGDAVVSLCAWERCVSCAVEAIADVGALEHHEAMASNRAVCEELIMSIYSTVAHGSVLSLPLWGLCVDDKILDQHDANASGRAFAKELL